MSISTTCSQCGDIRRFSEINQGRRFSCPECDTVILIPLEEKEILTTKNGTIKEEKSPEEKRKRKAILIIGASVLVLFIFYLVLPDYGLIHNMSNGRLLRSASSEPRHADSSSHPIDFVEHYNTIRNSQGQLVFHFHDLEAYVKNNALDATASSRLSEAGLPFDTYSIKNVLDSDPGSSWSEGVDGPGIGEFIEFTWEEEEDIQILTLINGYAVGNLYKMNNRVKQMEVTVWDDNGRTAQTLINLQDDRNGEYQVFRIEEKCIKIRFTIKDVYKGTHFDDTCIAEIRVR